MSVGFSLTVFASLPGIDEGLISGTVQQKAFISKYRLNDPLLSESERANLLGNITAMVQIGSIGGALLYVPPIPLLTSGTRTGAYGVKTF